MIAEQDNLNPNPAASTYYADGLVRSVADPGANTTRYAYDTASNPTRVTDPNGWSTTNTFAHNGLPATTRQPVDASTWRRTSWTYDLGGRKSTQHVELVDAAGNLKTNGDGGTQDFAWYRNDRLSLETGRQVGTTARPTIAYAYDVAGHPTALTHDLDPATPVGERVTAAEWYLDGLVRRVHDPAAPTAVDTAYAYDAAGEVAVRHHQDGVTTRLRQDYDFGDAGLPTTMRADALTAGGEWDWDYDVLSRPVRQEAPNGQTTTWDWQDDATLASLTLTDSADDPVASWSYTYDALYRITSQTHAGDPASGATTPDAGTWTYGYDPGGRMDSVDTDGSGPTPATDVTYDASGNRTAYGPQAWTYNRDNTVASHDDDTADATAAFTAFAYHPFGGLADDRCATYTYDGFDRVGTVDGKPACGDVTTTNTYDGAGRVATRAATGATTSFPARCPSRSTACRWGRRGRSASASSPTPSSSSSEPTSHR